MKLLYLNCIISIPNEVGEEKIQKATNKDTKIRDDKTPPKQWFLEQNLRPPDDAEDEVETDEQGNIYLEEHEMETIPVPVTIPLDNLGSWVSNVDGGSRVYTKSNLAYDVLEDVWEIDTVVEYTSMSWINKQIISFKSFLRKIKNKITGKKEVTYESIINAPENNPELINK